MGKGGGGWTKKGRGEQEKQMTGVGRRWHAGGQERAGVGKTGKSDG